MANPTPITTPDSGHAWSPDAYAYAAGDVLAPALILNATTVSGEIDGDQPALRVAYVKDDDSADYVAEAATITDSAPALDEAVVYTRKIARLVSVSSEQFGQEQTAGQLAQSVARDLIRQADRAFLGDAAPTPPATGSTGLLNATGLVDGDELDGDLDGLADLLGELEANEAHPELIVVDPLSWAALRKFKIGSDFNSTLLGAGVEDQQPRLLGLPVLRSPFIPAGSGLVIDRTAIVSAVGPVKIAQSEHALFANDAVQVRASWRIGWSVMRPERIGRFTVAGVDAGSS